jgi:hypothetical protein
MLRGCQFADNQFQALQNQEIEDLSVHGSRLLELQIQPLRISLRYLISRIWYLEDLCSSLLGHLQTFLYSPIALDVRKFLTVELILLCFPGPSETVTGSNFYFSRLLYYSVYPLSLCDKKGE